MKNNEMNMMKVMIAVVLITQAFVIVYLIERPSNIPNGYYPISSSDLNAKITKLSNNLQALSSNQTTLEKQIAQVKANSSNDFSGIISQSLKGVVTIKTDVAQGSGFFVSNDGYIVTNAHVITGASEIKAMTYDGNVHDVTLIGEDTNIDVALLKIVGKYQRLPIGDSDKISIGDRVVALGNPLGLSFTATEGIVSSKDRLGMNNLPDYIQSDVSLNPGNSGGPLINSEGQVIGINNFKISGAENIGFALEINKAMDAINKVSNKNLPKLISSG